MEIMWTKIDVKEELRAAVFIKNIDVLCKTFEVAGFVCCCFKSETSDAAATAPESYSQTAFERSGGGRCSQLILKSRLECEVDSHRSLSGRRV